MKSVWVRGVTKKVQARDENNMKGSWYKNSHEICMGQRRVTKRFKKEMKTI